MELLRGIEIHKCLLDDKLDDKIDNSIEKLKESLKRGQLLQNFSLKCSLPFSVEICMSRLDRKLLSQGYPFCNLDKSFLGYTITI